MVNQVINADDDLGKGGYAFYLFFVYPVVFEDLLDITLGGFEGRDALVFPNLGHSGIVCGKTQTHITFVAIEKFFEVLYPSLYIVLGIEDIFYPERFGRYGH